MTPAERKQQVEWDARLANNAVTLEDALMMTLHANVPASPYLIARLEAAFTDQREGRRHLADSFGSGRHGNEQQAINAEILARQVYDLVIELHQRHPKGHPEHMSLGRAELRTRKVGPTAYTKAAEILAPKGRAPLSESAIIKLYTKGKAIHDHDLAPYPLARGRE